MYYKILFKNGSNATISQEIAIMLMNKLDSSLARNHVFIDIGDNQKVCVNKEEVVYIAPLPESEPTKTH